MFNTWCRGTRDIAMILQENGLGLTPTGGIFSSFWVVLLLFSYVSLVFVTYFHFFTDLNIFTLVLLQLHYQRSF